MPRSGKRKPQLFISHASTDGEFANALKAELDKVFGDALAVFSSSSPGAIGGGEDWLDNVEKRLASADAIVVIVTPVSVERPWLWFEVGATWLKSRLGNCRIYPLCVPEIDLNELPSPLNRLQARSIARADDLKLLFQELARQFGFGKVSAFRAASILKRIPLYKDVKIQQIDREEPTKSSLS
jgi:TIR domain